MDIVGRRSSYTLLNQYSDEPQPHQLESDKSRGKVPFEWSIGADVTDACSGLRIGAPFPSIGLQRQSSGSSFGESSFSGEYYLPTTLSSVSATMVADGFDPIANNGVGEGMVKEGGEAVVSSSSSKSWAQQAEEAYQLQLALALRLCSEASCSNDPNYLDPGDHLISFERASAETASHRFWVNGSLSYNDKVPDGFYMIQGMDPFVWTLCTDVQEESRIPTVESLKFIQPSEPSINVILVDRYSDLELRQLHNLATGIASSFATKKEIVEQIAKLVCTQMGGAAMDEEHGLLPRWNECSQALKDSLRSVVIPVGKLSIGLCRHRALLFKILADAVHLPCRIAKGCKFCKRDDSSSCLVHFGFEREYLVDLIGTPGVLCEPNSLINGPYSITILSPLRPPNLKSSDIAENFKSLAKQYLVDCRSLDLMFADASTDATSSSAAMSKSEFFEVPQRYVERIAPDGQHGASDLHIWNTHMKITETSDQAAIEISQFQHIPRDEPKDALLNLAFPEIKANITKPKSSVPLVIDDLTIPWSDLFLKERIGAGSFGTVHHAEWHGSEVAVKILMDQDFRPEKLNEFLREVSIMKSLRHPNIVLFMGAVTEAHHLSIVTEYLSRGSLYSFLHKHGVREILDERRRLNMAFDVAKGMNYLHNRNPPIVHRDLKSPNLLVDKKYTVKVASKSCWS